MCWHMSGQRAPSEVFDVSDFGPRKSDAAQDGILKREHLVRCRMRHIRKQIMKPSHDRFRRATAELLMRDGPQQRIETCARLIRNKQDRASRFNDAPEV